MRKPVTDTEVGEWMVPRYRVWKRERVTAWPLPPRQDASTVAGMSDFPRLPVDRSTSDLDEEVRVEVPEELRETLHEGSRVRLVEGTSPDRLGVVRTVLGDGREAVVVLGRDGGRQRLRAAGVFLS